MLMSEHNSCHCERSEAIWWRYRASIRLVTLMGAGFMLSASLSGQVPAGAGKPAPAVKTARTWTLPRTAWGDPDLQGLWPGTDFVGVPLQRPDGLGTRNELTDAEFAARLAQAQIRNEMIHETRIVPLRSEEHTSELQSQR